MIHGVGVDLGTTFTAAALGAGGTAEMVCLGGSAVVVPSVAYLDPGEGLLTGVAADRLAAGDPARAAREVKRRLGDPTPLMLGGSPFSPAALMAAQLTDVLAVVASVWGRTPDRIVLTRPAAWGPYRREQFAAVATLAGLPAPTAPPDQQDDDAVAVDGGWRDGGTDGRDSDGDAAGEGSGDGGLAGLEVRTVSEPVAAVAHHAQRHPLPHDALLAVYDLGGGTFDSAVVHHGTRGLRVLGSPEGVEWLGGADFDQALVDHVDHALGGAVSRLDPGDPGDAIALATLRQECMLAKEQLSERRETTVRVALPDGVHRVAVRREAFERLITPSLETTVEAIRRSIAAAGVSPEDLDAVLLVGGSSRIPLVGAMVRAAFGRPVRVDVHPKHAVALGAAVLACGPGRAAAGVSAEALPGASRAPVTAPRRVTTGAPAGTAPTAPPTAPVGEVVPAGAVAPRSRREQVAVLVAAAATVVAVASLAAGYVMGHGDGGNAQAAGPGTAVTSSTAGSAGHGAGRPAATVDTVEPVAATGSSTGKPTGDLSALPPAGDGKPSATTTATPRPPGPTHGSPGTASAPAPGAPASRPCGARNLALFRPATASSAEQNVFTPRLAVDGDPSSRWGSDWRDPQWLQVDLGARYDVCRVRLSWERAYADRYRLEVSDDGVSWRGLAGDRTGVDGVQDLLVNGAGRYVRMYATVRHTDYGYSLNEFAVFARAR